MSELHLQALVSFALSAAVVVICICRLNVMTTDVMLRVRIEYACYVGGSVAMAFGPYMGYWPTPSALLLQMSLLFGLLCGAHAWRHEPPPTTISETKQERTG